MSKNMSFVQTFIEHNQPLTEHTIDENVVNAFNEVKSVEDYLRSDLFKNSSKEKVTLALRSVREDGSPAPWFTRGNKQSLTINNDVKRDKCGLNNGYPENYMLCYIIEPSGIMRLMFQLVNPFQAIVDAPKSTNLLLYTGSSIL
jgi:hypothetical protein